MSPSVEDQLPALIEDAVAHCVAYLESDAARRSLELDPYWPKWDSPWWHMTLLFELGLADRIPRAAARAMVHALNSHYLKFFPRTEEELPAGTDFYRHVPCHCGLGTMHQVLSACGIRVDDELSWVRPWFLKYQLPDGGLNCDEKDAKPPPKSSIVSTLPPLEAVLFCTPRPFTAEEQAFLDRGAEYLIAHRLFRSANGGRRIINEDWLKPCFPRFYEYDVLRGLRFLIHWAEMRKKSLPDNAIREAVDALRSRFPDGEIKAERVVWAGAKTKIAGLDGQWSAACDQPASSFELLRRAGRIGQSAPALSAQWREILSRSKAGGS